MKTIQLNLRKFALLMTVLIVSLGLNAQTNVYDDIIAVSPDHTSLNAAIMAAGLESALQNESATLTVFAPDNAAFDQLADDLGVTVADLLELPNLADILTYHVLGTTVPSSAVTNGAIVTPLNDANTVKLTLTSMGSVFANQAEVNAPDLAADNGVVHSTDAVLLPSETVVDIAIDNGFTSLTAAVITAELLPALTDPFGTYTVFAPDNAAFEDLATALGTDVGGLLELPNLADILLYHTLATEAVSGDLSNGLLVTPINDDNTIKVTVTSTDMVFANQAMVTLANVEADNGVVHAVDAVILPSETVVDIAIDNGFTSLTAAVTVAELLPALTDPFGTYTVFAPDNTAFDNLAAALGTDIDGLLALPNLGDILLYHTLSTEAVSGDLSNGLLVTPINDDNTIKVTVTSTDMVFANQAMVTLANVEADNGVVHAIDAVILPNETVVDIAIDNGFTSLAAAVTVAELLPALTDPFGTYTVFAPDNTAFDNLAAALGTDIDGLLALPNLGDILLYHTLSTEAVSGDLSNGLLVTPINDANTIKVTVTSTDMVFTNQAMVTLANVEADNGVVHAIDAVILPNETVVDLAIDNGLSTLATAVTTAELLPALTNPFGTFTVFAPDNDAFEDLAEALQTDLDGLLANPLLGDILLYHVVGEVLASTDLEDGLLETLYGESVNVDLSMGSVMINDAEVLVPNVTSENGIVHVIDEVLVPTTLSVQEIDNTLIDIYPNPTADFVNVNSIDDKLESFSIISIEGKVVQQDILRAGLNRIDLDNLTPGVYILKAEGATIASTKRLVIQ